MTSYQYSLFTFFRKGYNADVLQLDVTDVITKPLVSITVPDNNVILTFATALTAGEKTVLDTVVTNHDPASRTIISNLTILKHVNAVGTNAGQLRKNEWMTRPLNVIEQGSESVKLNTTTYRFRLAPGNYTVSCSAEVGAAGDHRIRIQNVTTNATAILGINCTTGIRAALSGPLTSTDFAHEWELQHIASVTRGGDGMGRAIGLGGDEIFTIVEIRPA